MDCMKGMKEFPDKYFELAIVDPPYGNNAPKMSMGSNKSRKGDGYPGISVAERIKKGRLNAGAGKLKNRALNTMSCNWDFEPPEKAYFDELFRVSLNQIIWGGNYFPLPPTRGIISWDKIQPWWVEQLNAQGRYATVCHGWESAVRTIEWYLRLPKSERTEP